MPARKGSVQHHRVMDYALHVGASDRLATTSMETLARFDRRQAGSYTEKALPQPQVVVALGLRITNCAALRAGFAAQSCGIVNHPRIHHWRILPPTSPDCA